MTSIQRNFKFTPKARREFIALYKGLSPKKQRKASEYIRRIEDSSILTRVEKHNPGGHKVFGSFVAYVGDDKVIYKIYNSTNTWLKKIAKASEKAELGEYCGGLKYKLNNIKNLILDKIRK